MTAMGKKTYMRYPKILTVTCVTCGGVVDVLVKASSDHRRRIYCSEKCEREYLAKARRRALESKRQGGRVYKAAFSTILAERPAACDAPKKRESEASIKAVEQKRRDLEYWAALRRSRGITVEALS